VKIVVYGAGAVGTFFGGLLARHGQEVQFVARGAQLEALRTRGIVIESTLIGQVRVPPLVAAPTAAHLDKADLILVCVKAHHTGAILNDLAEALRDTSIIVPLQNGVESDEVLAARFGRRRVATAVVYVGATLEQPGVVTHVAPGAIILGARLGFDAARLPGVRDVLAASGQQITVSHDILHERWYKLIWNAGFNPVSAVANMTPAQILAIPELRELVVGIMREVVAVANAQGIMLHEKDIQQQIAWTNGATAITTSMLVDRARGRSMEIDAVIGVIVRKGRELGVPTPLSSAMHALLLAADATRQPVPERSSA
jgi:2-dehydropantoate 2-reductase